MKRGRLVLALLVLTALVSATGARADASALDVTQLADGPELRGKTYVLRDAQGAATLDDVIRADAAGKLARTEAEISDGWSREAVWVRFDARNPSAQSVSWLLELAFPHLDYVDVYALHPDGRREHRVAGDHLPFAARELKHRNLLFKQTTAAQETVRYYLRARTEGSLRVPLRAWTADDFHAHDDWVSALFFTFYGAMLLMAWYNACVALVTRSREYAHLAGVLLFFMLAAATLSGHVLQYLLPASPLLANRALVVFIAIARLFSLLYGQETIRQLPVPPQELKGYPYMIGSGVLIVAVAALAPPGYGQREVFFLFAGSLPFGIRAMWVLQQRQDPEMRFTVPSFLAVMVGMGVALAAHGDFLPPHPLALWAGHIGCALFCLTVSLALPVRLRHVSGNLVSLNEQLVHNVDDLKVALGNAERATEEARRATLVKDEFMATMSHELRTPLNAIINVPQGLLDDFPSVRSATCGMCSSTFVLEPSDRVDASTSCPDCQEVGSLREGTITHYIGKPAHTARFLAKIERSGHHLLQMVNGVLDFSKMEAGRLELNLEPIDIAELLHETTDELVDVARTRGIEITLHLADSDEPGLGDAIRLRQVLLNLLSNAIKFSEPQGVIDVRWKRDPDNDVISVTDRGIGIAVVDHSRVFATFEQVHKGDTRKYGGTGLGLSISRSLIRMHGGELWVESRLGEGATFTFRVPRVPAFISTEPANDHVPNQAVRPPPRTSSAS